MTDPRRNDATVDIEQSVIEQFKRDWRCALLNGDPPDMDRALAALPRPIRARVRGVLETVDAEFRAASTSDRLTTEDGKPTAAAAPSADQRNNTKGTQKDGDTTKLTPVPPDQPAWNAETVGLVMDATAPEKPAYPRVSGYEIVGILGRGGMGVVYRARQSGLNRIVAMKMVLSGANAAPRQFARFHAEAQAIAQLQHVNIAQVYDVGEHDGLPYYSMEFVDGGTLSHEINGSPLPPSRAADVVMDVARAIGFAHSHGIVHRDLKPGNILMTKDGVPKVADFGLVKRLEQDSGQTQTGEVVGTPSYMAPEQARSAKDIGALADVYALGGILYCMLTGRPPFIGSSSMETIMQVLNDELVPPNQLQPKTPPDLNTICVKCLQKDPAKRYQSAMELAEDLRRFRAGEPITARPVSRRERVWQWCRRNPRLAVATSIAALLMLVLSIGGPSAAILVYRQKQHAIKLQRAAETSEVAAKKSAQEADRQREIANSERDLANEQTKLAEEVNRRVVYLVHQEVGRDPAFRKLRGQILDIAREGLEKVHDDKQGSAARDIMTASVFRKWGDLCMEIGETGRAIEHLERALALGQKAFDAGRFPEGHWNLANVYEQIGNAKLLRGDVDGAREACEQLLEHRLQQDDTSTELRKRNRRETSRAYAALGNVAKRRGDIATAREYYTKGLEIRKEWTRAEPENLQARSQYADALSNMSDMTLSFGDYAAARQYAQQTLAELREVAKVEPDDRAKQYNVALKAGWVGYVCTATGNAIEGIDFYTEALNILAMLHQQDPENASIRDKLAAFHYEIGNAHFQLDDLEESREHYEISKELREALVAKDTGNPFRQAGLMLSLARCEQVDRATALAEKLEKDHPNNPAILIRVACSQALCGAVVEQKSNAGEVSTTSVSSEIEQRYLRAIELLKKCIELGFHEFVLMRIDPDLYPLQQRADFNDILDAAEAAAGSQPVA